MWPFLPAVVAAAWLDGLAGRSARETAQRKPVPPRSGQRWPAIATEESCKHVVDFVAVREALEGSVPRALPPQCSDEAARSPTRHPKQSKQTKKPHHRAVR